MKPRIVEVSLDVSGNTESEGRLWFHGRVKIRPFSMPSPGCKRPIVLPLIQTFPCPEHILQGSSSQPSPLLLFFRLSVAKHVLAGYSSQKV